MRPSQWLASASVIFSASVAAAQGGTIDPQCASGTLGGIATQDACQKTVDVYRFLAPQLGLAIAGGNAVLGESAALDGFGHVSLGFRVNGLRARLPRSDLVTPAIGGAQSSDFQVDRRPFGIPILDAAVGLFPGVKAAGSRAFALDGLVNVAYVPALHRQDVEVTLPDGSLRLGYGGRLTLLDESIVTPAITAEFIRRDLPHVDVVVTPGSDELAARNVHVETTAWRAVVGKHLGSLALTVGAGQDRYNSGADVSVQLNRAGQTFAAGPLAVSQRLTRTNVLAGVALDLPLLRIAGEFGRASGGTIPTYNTFGSFTADDAMLYASLGLRFHW